MFKCLLVIQVSLSQIVDQFRGRTVRMGCLSPSNQIFAGISSPLLEHDQSRGEITNGSAHLYGM